jgi:hypothetical protein
VKTPANRGWAQRAPPRKADEPSVIESTDRAIRETEGAINWAP